MPDMLRGAVLMTMIAELSFAYNLYPKVFIPQKHFVDHLKADRFRRPCEVPPPTKSAVESIWFPINKKDLDHVSQSSEDGGQLSSDHPGFNDPIYRSRRRMIADKALQYRFGQDLPTIDYTASEQETWKIVYQRLRAASRRHAVDEYNRIVEEMERSFGFGASRIPQMHEVPDRS